MNLRIVLALLASLIVSGPCLAQVKAAAGIEPVGYFVERVGGEHVRTEVLVRAGGNPHTFEPSPRVLAAVSEATLFFAVGMPFETRLVDKIRGSNAALELIDLRKGITLRAMAEGEACTHEAGGHEHEGHGEGAPDPHIWLSPLNAKIMAATIHDALAAADPAHAEAYGRNLAALQADLDALHQRLAQELAPYRGRAFYAYHPAFGYFADAYGLRQIPVEIEGKEPSAKQLTETIARAKADGARAVFVQKQFSQRAAQSLAAELRAQVIELDPLARDYIPSLQQLPERLRNAWEGTP